MNKAEIRKLVLDAYHREGDQISQRIDWSLIFHAILLEAFVAAHEDFYIQVTIGSLGFVVAFLWLVIGARQNWLMRHLIEALKQTANQMMQSTCFENSRIFAKEVYQNYTDG